MVAAFSTIVSGDNQYRIKSLRDGHERVVKESDLSVSPT
jgi:hypothetical protein